MLHYVIDQYSHQPAYKRLIWNTLTGLGWLFWIYLWQPLLSAIVELTGAHSEQVTSRAAHSIQDLLTTLLAHANTVVAMIATFVFWAILQWLVKRFSVIKKSKLNKCRIGASIKQSDNEIKRWRDAQRVMVYHDEKTGVIRNVKVIYPSHL